MNHDDLITKIGDLRDEESGIAYYRIPMSAGPDAEPVPILDLLRERFADHGCSCSHDCCGHWQTDHGRLIGTDAIREHYLIAQSFYRNV